jgi:hypothetical protein
MATQSTSNGTAPNGAAPNGHSSTATLVQSLTKDLRSQATRIPQDIGILKSFVSTKLDQGLTDDRK